MGSPKVLHGATTFAWKRPVLEIRALPAGVPRGEGLQRRRLCRVVPRQPLAHAMPGATVQKGAHVGTSGQAGSQGTFQVIAVRPHALCGRLALGCHLAIALVRVVAALPSEQWRLEQRGGDAADEAPLLGAHVLLLARCVQPLRGVLLVDNESLQRSKYWPVQIKSGIGQA